MSAKFSRLFHKNTTQDRIHIHPKYLHSNLDEAITAQVQKKVEGICNRDGYVKRTSVSLLKRSIGVATSNDTNGYVTFDVLYSIDICNPMSGEIYPCIIKKSNKMGFLAQPLEKPNPLVIVIAKQHVQDKDLLNSIQEGDYVSVKIIGARFDLGDDKISVVATLLGRINKVDIPAFLLLEGEEQEASRVKAKGTTSIVKSI
jgi:DNA-directed RNA polymerase subunit E'/Rpb7